MRKFLVGLIMGFLLSVTAVAGVHPPNMHGPDTYPAQCTGTCDTAFRFVVSHEDRNLSGVVSREPFGGVARFGVNSHAHPEAIRVGFYKMSRTKALRYAENLFYRQYWLAVHGDELESRLAVKMSDLAYNLGPVRATILLQRALNEMGASLVTKGVFGGETVFAATMFAGDPTVELLKLQATGFYTRLAKKHPDVFRAWKGVWLARTAEG